MKSKLIVTIAIIVSLGLGACTKTLLEPQVPNDPFLISKNCGEDTMSGTVSLR
jgi:hypothetical protein